LQTLAGLGGTINDWKVGLRDSRRGGEKTERKGNVEKGVEEW